MNRAYSVRVFFYLKTLMPLSPCLVCLMHNVNASWAVDALSNHLVTEDSYGFGCAGKFESL